MKRRIGGDSDRPKGTFLVYGGCKKGCLGQAYRGSIPALIWNTRPTPTPDTELATPEGAVLLDTCAKCELTSCVEGCKAAQHRAEAAEKRCGKAIREVGKVTEMCFTLQQGVKDMRAAMEEASYHLTSTEAGPLSHREGVEKANATLKAALHSKGADE
jgi:hypothetical protein